MGGARRAGRMPAEEQQAREKQRKLERVRGPTVEIAAELRADWERRGKPDGNLKAHLVRLYWANSGSSPAQARAEGAREEEAAQVQAAQVALQQLGEQKSKAPKLKCKLRSL